MNTYKVTTINRDEHVVKADTFNVNNGFIVFLNGDEVTHYFPGSVIVAKSENE
jgi:hypothetical protein